MSNAEQLAVTLNACERSGIWYRSGDAANELLRLQAEVERLTAENAELRKDSERAKPSCSECADWIARCQAARQWKAGVAEGNRIIAAQVAAMRIDNAKAVKETP